jgi:hypothetical protein
MIAKRVSKNTPPVSNPSEMYGKYEVYYAQGI